MESDGGERGALATMHGAHNPYKQYKQTQVNTASQGDLLMLLLDAAVREGNFSIEALKAEKYAEANTHLIKAQEIVAELMGSLNYEVDFAQHLFRLYEYCHHLLVLANVNKSADDAVTAVQFLSELRAVWAQVLRGEGANPKAAEDRGDGVGVRPAGGGFELAH